MLKSTSPQPDDKLQAPMSGQSLKCKTMVVTTISALLLSCTMVLWQDLFLFAKSIHLPTWAKSLPSPVFAPSYLAFLCLIPAALFSPTLSTALRAVLITLCVSPLPALMLYANQPRWSLRHDLWVNLLFNYVWMIGFFCLLPAIVLLLARFIWQVVKQAVE